MIEHVLAHLHTHGIDDAVLSLGYRPDAFLDAYPEGVCAGVTVHYAVEPEPLDTAGAIRFAARHAAIDERFVVVNGDVLTDLDVGALMEFHAERGAEATIALHKVEDPSAFGVVPTDPDGRVLAFVEKPPRDEAPTDLINAGTYVFEPSMLDRIPEGRKVSIERETFPRVVTDGRLFATTADTYWIDAGTPAKYLEAQLDLLHGRFGPPVPGVSPAAEVSSDAVLTDAVVGAEAVIHPGVVIERSVVLPGAEIHEGAEVRDSIIGARATVGSRAVIRNLTVLGNDVEVAAGERLDGVKRPQDS
jgi:mannose-1-phosphate guanylyltransferase